jgi:hypothetical protein
MRTMVAVAPPRYQVSKMAPRIEVRGVTYSRTHANKTIPIG